MYLNNVLPIICPVAYWIYTSDIVLANMQPLPWKTRVWHQWKSLKNIPFRRKWFIGYDLDGNSYWELIDHNNPFRLRRKVEMKNKHAHIGDFKPLPQWMQWLRHTRANAPTMEELLADQRRQARIRLLAQEAEQRWASVPLKSNDSAKGSDPRMSSAWMGTPSVKAPQPEPVPQPFVADPLAARMMEAQRKIQEDDKKKSKKLEDDQEKKDPWAAADAKTQDEPSAASFAPKR